MKKMLLGAVVSCAMLSPVAGQSKSPSLQGAWRVTEVTLTGPNAMVVKSPRTGDVLFTAKHYSLLITPRGEARLDLPQSKVATATADELRAAWNLLIANVGTYESAGDVLTTKV